MAYLIIILTAVALFLIGRKLIIAICANNDADDKARVARKEPRHRGRHLHPVKAHHTTEDHP